MNHIVHVAVAVIRNPAGQVFITVRPDHVHQGGLWEFPGGKVESGESVQDALRREIHEENGIDVQEIQPLIRIPYQYPDKHVLLDVWEVKSYQGEAHGREGQACRWVAAQELTEYDFPAANRAIITAVQLPAYYLITPEPGDDHAQFFAQLESRLDSGVSLLQFRARQLPEKDYLAVAETVIRLCDRYQASVLLNTTPQLFTAHFGQSASGIHVRSQELMKLTTRPVAADQWFAASCHNLQEINQAKRLGADFIVLGPVKPTASHPQQQAMGWEKFAELTEQATMPVYALGGMSVDDAVHSRHHGGQGIAAIRSLWGSA